MEFPDLSQRTSLTKFDGVLTRPQSKLRASVSANLGYSLDLGITSIRQGKPAFDQGKNTQCALGTSPESVQISAGAGEPFKVYAAVTMIFFAKSRCGWNQPSLLARAGCLVLLREQNCIVRELH